MAQSEGTFAEKFDRSEAYYRSWLGDLTDDVDGVLASARDRYSEMGPTLAYADEPDHPMAFSLFTCAALLCLYMALREKGVDAHDFGSRMLKALTEAVSAAAVRTARSGEPDAGEQAAALKTSVESLIDAGERSQAVGQTGAFEFDVRWIDEASGHYAMEMRRCGICHLYGQHDALDLVPYMCATDDVMSEAQGQGLQRTGTIALGSRCCDFDFESGRSTSPVARSYPDRIRVIG
jgi:hypothetical protein